MKKRVKKFLPSLLLFLLVGVVLGVILGSLIPNDNDVSFDLCSPGLFCLDDVIAYRSLSCGLLVGVNEKVNEVCEGGKFVESHPLVRTAVGSGNPLLIIDTELLDLQEEEFEWEYFPSGDFVDGLQASPSRMKFSGVNLAGVQDGRTFVLVLN